MNTKIAKAETQSLPETHEASKGGLNKGKAAARGAAGIACLYWKRRHPPRRKRKELEVPDKQLDNDKTGNSTADEAHRKPGRAEASKPRGRRRLEQGQSESGEVQKQPGVAYTRASGSPTLRFSVEMIQKETEPPRDHSRNRLLYFASDQTRL